MPINVNDITFVDISELSLLESLTGDEEIQVSDKNKINLKALLNGFITSSYFTTEIAKYYQKTQTYDRVEVDTKMSTLSTNLNNALQNYVASIEDALDRKVTAVTGSRLITEEEADSIAEAVTRTALEAELLKKVDAEPGAGLITDAERTKLDDAVDSATLSTELAKKVDAEPGAGLITDAERTKLDDAVDSATLSTELAKKVTAVANQRLITEQEATKLAYAVTSGDLESYSLKDTGVLEETVEVPKEEKQYIKFFDEVNGIEKKITMSNFILGASNPVYPTARVLVGEKNGSNETFTSEYNYIAGSEKLNINGSIYYPNSGFYKEGDKIILSGAPIPEAGDFMFLEAIYLD